ncbi:TonB-dependent receptor [Sandaracinobacteroides saxicola]|uniref:TonB-dependent receptor n=1 Tax=Sandaracinobacteroides saxicola TaxID=2759707 RepID=A0A7G5IG04_9SPHN|nr:TonB-dependent receptor [Sandaracinobacteroides saxicola]QMW22296.1 TonB-dependent receptor [Sandaracinobacteroides saxicola]
MKYLLLAATLLATPTFSQTPAATTAAEEEVGEIIVTAQKSAQKLIDVPVTITAYSGETLQRLGIGQFDQLSAFVPGLNIQEQSPNNPGFVIRGITSDSGSAQEAARVTVYYNGVDVSRSRGSYFDLFDLERVEVVKGPQATLFGTASAIGAVSVISARPSPGTSGNLSAAYGNFEQFRLSGMLNSAGEQWGARLAFAVKKRDGVVPNLSGLPGSNRPAGPKSEDLNGQDQIGVRGSLFAQFSDSLRADLIVTYDGQKAPGTAFKSGNLPPTGGNTSPYAPAELGGSPFSAQVLGAPALGLNRNVWDVNLTLRWKPDASPFSVTSITGWRRFDSLEVFDADGSPAWFLEFAEDARGRQLSHETRVNYDGDRIRGFVGANIFHETGSQRVPFSTEEGTYLQCAARLIPGLPCVDAGGTVRANAATALLTRGAATVLPYSSEFRNEGDITTGGIFADITVLPTPRLELTAGARLLWERRTSGYFARQPNSVITRAPLLPIVDTGGATFTARDTSDAFLPRFNALFRATDRINFYATISKGRRSPIVQLASAPGPVPARTNIPAETVWNYEGGVKAGFGAISGSLGIFHQTYDNFQVQISEGGRVVTRNAGSAKNTGVEAELNARPIPQLLLFGNVGYIDAKIDNIPQNGIFAGQRFRLQPKWQAAAGATLTLGLTETIDFVATPTVTHRSSLFFELPNRPNIAQGPVTLVNLRAGVQASDGRWQLTAFANNLTDKEYLLDAGNTGGAFGTPTFIRGLPRLYGLEATVRF